MLSSARLGRFLGVASLLVAAWGCGGDPKVGGGGDKGEGSEHACAEIFGDACGQSCTAEEACPAGMYCDDGKCDGECSKDFACMDGFVCTKTGKCQTEGLDVGNGEDDCEARTCKEMEFACGVVVDDCGKMLDCAKEGLTCKADEMCVGGIDSPTECVPAGSLQDCDLCDAIPDCDAEEQETILSGRVVSPGRDDDDTANQVGVPNALVYILRNNDIDQLPAMDAGLPAGGTSCDRCEDQDVGPVLAGAVSDSTGHFELVGRVPVGEEFLFVVKAGKFRRAIQMTLDAGAACTTNELPEGLPANPARLPRNMQDGLAVNIPRVAVSTGAIDAMECVFRKMGIDADQFGRPGTAARIHLYHAVQGGGGWPDQAAFDCSACGDGDPGGGTTQTCRTTYCGGATLQDKVDYLEPLVDHALLGDASTLDSYDLSVLDCEGGSYDSGGAERDDYGDNVRHYVNRGGRMFASHLSFTWLDQNGDLAYDADTAEDTGLSDASTWDTDLGTLYASGIGVIANDAYPNVSPRIESFTDWMVNEGITTGPDYEFDLSQPRSMSIEPGDDTEVFVYRNDENERVQQFSFNTPLGAPEDAICGRVAYSGFHVAAAGGGNTPFANQIFPNYCEGTLGNEGVLTDQEKVLLYMLFDLGACVGDDPPPPPCVAATCKAGVCGLIPDGCGDVVDCGTCGPVTR